MLFITQLRHEHDLLLTLADELESACSGERPDDLTPLLVLLERFNQLLQIHLLREDSVLYPAMIEGEDPDAATLAILFQDELGGLDRHLAEFDAKWANADISTRWFEFCLEIAGLAAELRLRIERENEELYPLAERCPRLAA
ncbi:MAG: hemerythrin domain-containing protein [Pseudomonadota bacterium]|nr:hemerythrin domain-containing protein [Pseudomonadota bacterium]